MSWQLPISQPNQLVAQAGPLTFAGGVADFDDDGEIRHPGDLGLQIAGALDNLNTSLAEHGCSLEDIVRLKAYYRSDGTLDEWRVLARLLDRFASEIAPAITLHPVPLQPFANQEIQIQAMALKGWRDLDDVRVVEMPVPQAAASQLPRTKITAGLRAGEFFAVPAVVAMDETGQALSPGEGLAQTDRMMTRIGEILEDLGAGFQDAVKAEGYYFGTTLDEWAPMAARRAESFREPGPVATVVPCHALWPQDCVTKFELVGMRAHLNGFDKYIPREDRWPERVWDWPIPVPYRQGIRLREMIWTGGQVPFEEGMNEGRPVHAGDLVAQTRFTMGYVNEIVEAFDKTTRDYALLVCYFASDGDPSTTQTFVDAIAETIDGPLPPMTLVPQPHMHSADMTVEIWGVADNAS